jgi:hypothetical protein
MESILAGWWSSFPPSHQCLNLPRCPEPPVVAAVLQAVFVYQLLTTGTAYWYDHQLRQQQQQDDDEGAVRHQLFGDLRCALDPFSSLWCQRPPCSRQVMQG